jgi:inner membrane protein
VDNTRTAPRESVMVKLVITIVLALLLMAPAMMIQGVIREREDTRSEAVAEVSSKWGGPQTLGGPVLRVPFRLRGAVDAAGNQLADRIEYASFLPADLKITGTLAPEIRYRGIFEAVLYTGRLNFSGSFGRTFRDWGIAPEDILWKDATVSLGIPDMKGIRESVTLVWDGARHPFQPGVPQNHLFHSGITAALPDSSTDSSHTFSIDLSLNGSSAINFLPLGRETTVELGSSWGNPSFSGAFLPVERTVTPQSFTARWKVLDMNRNYPQEWRGVGPEVTGSEFGVGLMVPVDGYQQTTRSVKYAGLFIALTFLSFFLIEMTNRLRLHPIQYLLTGSALVIFYLLLLSLSEYLDFGLSYAVAASATVLLITSYVASASRSMRIAGVMFGVLSFLYAALYILLQLQDYSLLFGSVGLFLILAVVMYVTRKMDWYALRPTPTPVPVAAVGVPGAGDMAGAEGAPKGE